MQTLLLDRRTSGIISEGVPKGETLSSLVRFFSVFSDATRLKLLSALAISELCVTDLSRVLSLNQTTVSHQLRYLKDSGLVRCERHGKSHLLCARKRDRQRHFTKRRGFLGF